MHSIAGKSRCPRQGHNHKTQSNWAVKCENQFLKNKRYIDSELLLLRSVDFFLCWVAVLFVPINICTLAPFLIALYICFIFFASSNKVAKLADYEIIKLNYEHLRNARMCYQNQCKNSTAMNSTNDLVVLSLAELLLFVQTCAIHLSVV